MNSCDFQADNVFGPRVVSCRDGFDFTLLFEQSILSLVPSALALLASASLLFHLGRQNVKTKPESHRSLRAIKQVPILGFVATQLALVVLWSSPSTHPTKLSLASSCLSLVMGLILATLSFIEHTRSVRPSTFLSLYMVLSTLLDLPQSRTLWLRQGNASVAATFTVGLGFKLIYLAIELLEKREILNAPYSLYPPEALAGLVNRAMFWWINSLLIGGSRSILQLDHLFILDSDLTSEKCESKLKRAWQFNSRDSPHALLWTTLHSFGEKFIAIVVFRLGLVGFKFCQPLLINRAIHLLQETDSLEKTNTGRALIGATCLIYIGIALATGFFRHNVYRLITMVRSALTCLIYDATLHIDTESALEAEALTLMSTDFESIASGMEFLDSPWADPIEISIAVYLLYAEIGLAFIVPFITSLFFIAVPIFFRDVSTTAQKEWLESIGHRVATIASVLGNMKAVKMLGLPELVGERVQALRVHELKVASRFRKMISLSIVIAGMSRVAVPVLSLVTYVLLIRDQGMAYLTTAKAFTTLSLVSLLAYPIQNIAKATPRLAAASGCFQRIQEYITNSLTSDMRNGTIQDRGVASRAPEMGMGVDRNTSEKQDLIRISDADFAISSSRGPILFNIDLSISPKTWTVVIGPVGCGKSLLLLAMLNELRLCRGSVNQDTSLCSGVGYCTQEPWLPNMSIRDVICSSGAAEVDEGWYKAVLDACVLRPDLDGLPAGDRTVIGSNGVSLSGGQRQRLALARALYTRKPFLILDDVLSGLDPNTEQAIVDNVLGSSGIIQKHGISAVLVTHSIRHAWRADHVIVMKEGGRILDQGPPSHVASHLADHGNDYSKDFEASTSLEKEPDTHPDILSPASQDESEALSPGVDEADMARRTGDLKLYAYYLRSLGWLNAICIAIAVIVYAVFARLPTLWVRWWTEAEVKEPGKQSGFYAGVYGAFGSICMASLAVCLVVAFGFGVPRSSNALHAILLKATMDAPYWFFVPTDTGDLINRFSQDMSLVCMQLPITLIDTMFDAAVCIVGGILITMASKWAAAILPVLIAILYTLQKFYLRTSRQMRLLDLEAKAPLYSYFLETLRGAMTIRAFGWQTVSKTQYDILLDRSQRPFYLMYGIQRWLNLVLDLLVAGIATLIVALATQLNDSSAGALGVSLLNILTFSQDLTYLIRSWTDVETSLGAVARIKSFEAETPCEHGLNENTEPPVDWPTSGRIEFNNVSAAYRLDDEPILKNLSLVVPAGTKVGICGRTGSGKSTLLLSLLRLVEIQSGEIIVDGVSTDGVPRNTLRQRTIAVPQEPLMLPGTIRLNIDPFQRREDNEIFSILGDLGLSPMVQSIEGGLDASMSSLSLSRGQQQLFCLASALLGDSCLVALDEITSSVDTFTEEKMMAVVHQRAAGKTVLAVAHRLDTIREFDMIIVLDQGSIVETGRPEDLLQRETLFRNLWDRQH